MGFPHLRPVDGIISPYIATFASLRHRCHRCHRFLWYAIGFVWCVLAWIPSSHRRFTGCAACFSCFGFCGDKLDDVVNGWACLRAARRQVALFRYDPAVKGVNDRLHEWVFFLNLSDCQAGQPAIAIVAITRCRREQIGWGCWNQLVAKGYRISLKSRQLSNWVNSFLVDKDLIACGSV